MKASVSWSPAPSLNVVSVQRGEQDWTVTVDSRQPTSCPGCGTQSTSHHSAYSRTLRDLTAQGAPVIISARLARWRCRNQRCDRRMFTERVPGLAAPFARQTARLAGIVRLLGHSAGGPWERLMRRLGMPVSDTTILRSLKEHVRARCDNGAVHVAGIDDWAWRKGANCGTIIVNLERRQVVDLLTDRSAATAAGWFKDHPEVEVVSRDRAGLYAEAARQGASQARQVADRFHLLQNFRETVERQLGRFEAPISDSRVNARDDQATPPLPADQQIEEPQASDVWPRRCRLASSSDVGVAGRQLAPRVNQTPIKCQPTVAFVASVIRTDKGKAAQEGREIRQAGEDAHEAARGVEKDAVSQPRDDGVWRQN